MALVPRATDEEKVNDWNDRMQLQAISNPKHNTSTLLYLFGNANKVSMAANSQPPDSSESPANNWFHCLIVLWGWLTSLGNK